MVVKQADLRSNLKKYFDIVVDHEPVIVPRKDNRNVVILSEEKYRELRQVDRIRSYSGFISGRSGASEYGQSGAGNALDVPYIKSYTETTDIKSDNMDRLAVIGSFQDDWNGNGAAAFDKDLISKVTDIVRNLEIQPEIFPSAMGTIELEYDNSRKDFMSIEIGTADKAEIFIVMYNGSEYFESIGATAANINERIKKFYE